MPLRAGKAIVLGCLHGGLAVTKSLQRIGVEVLVLTADPRESGLKSKHVKQWHVIPHPRDQEAFIAAILGYAEDWAGAVIFPTSDYTASSAAQHKERLSKHFIVAVSDWEQTRVFLEKDSTYRLANETGVAHPRFTQPGSMEELEAEIADMQLPIMIKPVHSHSFTEKFRTKLFINNSADELRENFARVLEAGEQVFVCEIIPGDDYKTLETVQFYIDSKGGVAAAFCCMKYRQMPPMWGVIRAGTSIPPSQELIALGRKLLEGIDYRGYASAEFKRDPRDGKLKLMEVNIRALQMSQLPIASGVDFPAIIYRDLALDEQTRVDVYNPEMNYIEIAADIAGFLFLDETRNLRRFLEPYRKRYRTYPFFDLRDPMPFLADIWRRGSKLLTKGTGRRQ